MNNYQLPTLQPYPFPQPLLTKEEEGEKTSRIIQVFNDLGITISHTSVTPGPVVSLWEIQTDGQTELSNLESDLLKTLDIPGTRLSLSFPDKSTIGLEIPNDSFQTIPLGAVMNTRTFKESQMELPLALGVTVTGRPYVVDLSKLPHVLIAGTIGTGRAVLEHAMIMSLLCSKSPDDVKLVLIDPHMVEFTVYEYLAPFLAKSPLVHSNVVTETSDAIHTLEGLCELMGQRYSLLREAEASNITDYNQKVKVGKLDFTFHQHMPYIVAVIDEFGILTMTAGMRFELLISRIAQLSRAVGIHLIISTQRPSSQIVTGIIKANFPCRMAFKVFGQSDSRIILDYPGGECLRYRGDMLVSCGEEPVRLQGAYVDELEEVPAVCEQIIGQRPESSPYLLPIASQQEEEIRQKDFTLDHLDPLFENAAELLVEKQTGSVSWLQRTFCIGYNRAGRLMDMLEEAGIVGCIGADLTRPVLIPDSDALKEHLDKLKEKTGKEKTSKQGAKQLFVNGEYNCDRDLFAAVAKYVVENQNASISFVQRRFGLGFNQAGLIIDKLAMHGIVGPSVRTVLVKNDEELADILRHLPE